jgi:hypothetical protein
MPLMRCETDGSPGWKWGEQGKCYSYTAGDEASETAARKKAMAQAAAMGEFEGTGDRASTLTEVEHRNSQLQDVNKKKRLIDILAVPWDEEADVEWRGEIWHETHDRHAYDGIQDHVGRIQVNREHRKGDTVGRIVHADPSHPDGLLARVKAYSTDRGEETLILADEGGAFPSIGFRVKSFADMVLDKRTMSRRIMKSFWDHQAFVEDPAFVGAKVLAVRAGQSGLATVNLGPLPETPALDDYLQDPLLQWAAARARPRD